MSCRLLVALSAVVSLSSATHAYILIDDFTVGEYHTSITGTGNRDNLSLNLDRAHCFAGERGTNYTVSRNPFGYTTFFDIAGHQAKVTTPGPEDFAASTLRRHLYWPSSAQSVEAITLTQRAPGKPSSVLLPTSIASRQTLSHSTKDTPQPADNVQSTVPGDNSRHTLGCGKPNARERGVWRQPQVVVTKTSSPPIAGVNSIRTLRYGEPSAREPKVWRLSR